VHPWLRPRGNVHKNDGAADNDDNDDRGDN
jgi:hypothetical protein